MDMGIHDFTFAIMPHVARMQESGVYAQALQYVNPVRSKFPTYLGHLVFLLTSPSLSRPKAST